MDRIKSNSRKIFSMLAWIALISIFVAFLVADASAREVESTADLSVQDAPVQMPPQQKNHVDPLSLAIVGVSLGCMMFAASVNRNRIHRRQLETQIQELDSFLANNCSVGFHINGCNDNDPMVNSVKDIQNGRDMKLKEYEEHKNITVRSISEIEAEVMTLWG